MGDFPKGMRMNYGKRMHWRCEVCKREWKNGWMLEFHHKIPTSIGGKDTYENMEILCRECHLQRHIELRHMGKDHPNSVGIIRARIYHQGLKRTGY